MNSNNLFIQRRFQVQREKNTELVHFVGSIYISYYFYVGNELYVSKYALCVKYSKTLAEVKQQIKHPA